MSKLFKLLSIISMFRGHRGYGHHYGYAQPYHHRSFKTYLAERVLRRLIGRRY